VRREVIAVCKLELSKIIRMRMFASTATVPKHSHSVQVTHT